MVQHKYVYFFGNGGSDGSASDRNLLGGKGAYLAEMANIHVPIPSGFTITTEVCTAYYDSNNQYPEGVKEQVEKNLKKLEEVNGTKFGDSDDGLLLSVRSGARISMPGMMDTVLNLGLTDITVEGLARKSGNPRFAYDCYRRFITMFGDVVLDIDHADFEKVLNAKKKELGVTLDTELDVDALKDLVGKYKTIVKKKANIDFPQDPMEQLWMAVDAVFDSWNNQRAITYRRINKIPDNWGTAVNVQTMVYGNMGDTSGTGVAFTRDPATGESRFFGEYLINAQGEDVVAGTRTPQPIETLKSTMPEVYSQLEEIYKKLELHFKDMQDIEFTIQEGKLYMLQSRTGKRTANAAINIAVDMVNEGLIDVETAVLRIAPEQLDQLLHPMIDPAVKVKVIAKGLAASPGAAMGRVVFDAETAEKWVADGEKVILVRSETSPEDIGGMHVAEGILTVHGGMTSHAAVVARGMGKCCVAGCGQISINEEGQYFTVNGATVNKGDHITLNGSTGEVILGQVKLITSELSGNLDIVLEWADGIKKLKIRTNADTPHDAKIAREFGAEGIGLCRTEHMFFAEDRIEVVRQMILAGDEYARKQALIKLLPMQKKDFIGIFEAMDGYPVTIRLLDPPLHEFLPSREDAVAHLVQLKEAGSSGNDNAGEIEVFEQLIKRIDSLHELNPMLGHRGCRLGITYPEIYAMQAEAIIEAACELSKRGKTIIPEIMIPLVGHSQELVVTKRNVMRVAELVMEKHNLTIKYQIGTMIELPRAALIADKIAKDAEFFSFGTNDLTQTTLGYSRDDAGKFLPYYIEHGILDIDPFVAIDQEGVGELMKIGVAKGRSTRPDLKIGICGEHGGEPSSIEFAHRIGLNYVSCSPYRVPIARIAAAHAALKNR